PRRRTAATPALAAAASDGSSSASAAAAARANSRMYTPNRGPLVPPAAMKPPLSAANTALASREPSSPAVARSSDGSRLVPKSPSPPRRSSSSSSARCSRKPLTKAPVQARIASASRAPSTPATLPAEAGREHGRVPELEQLGGGAHERDRAAAHVERGHVGPDERARDLDAAGVQELDRLQEHQRKLEQVRRA